MKRCAAFLVDPQGCVDIKVAQRDRPARAFACDVDNLIVPASKGDGLDLCPIAQYERELPSVRQRRGRRNLLRQWWRLRRGWLLHHHDWLLLLRHRPGFPRFGWQGIRTAAIQEVVSPSAKNTGQAPRHARSQRQAPLGGRINRSESADILRGHVVDAVYTQAVIRVREKTGLPETERVP